MPTPKARRAGSASPLVAPAGGRRRSVERRAEMAVQLQEALEQQRATAEILRVISNSPTDVRPAFEVIAKSAVQLCHGHHGAVYQFDGELIHFVTHYNLSPAGVEAIRQLYPIAPNLGSVTGRAILHCAVAQIPDVSATSPPTFSVVAGRRTPGRSGGEVAGTP